MCSVGLTTSSWYVFTFRAAIESSAAERAAQLGRCIDYARVCVLVLRVVLQGFPDQDPIFRKDGEDQAYLTAMTTFFQVALPDNDQVPLVTYVYVPKPKRGLTTSSCSSSDCSSSSDSFPPGCAA